MNKNNKLNNSTEAKQIDESMLSIESWEDSYNKKSINNLSTNLNKPGN